MDRLLYSSLGKHWFPLFLLYSLSGFSFFPSEHYCNLGCLLFSNRSIYLCLPMKLLIFYGFLINLHCFSMEVLIFLFFTLEREYFLTLKASGAIPIWYTILHYSFHISFQIGFNIFQFFQFRFTTSLSFSSRIASSLYVYIFRFRFSMASIRILLFRLQFPSVDGEKFAGDRFVSGWSVINHFFREHGYYLLFVRRLVDAFVVRCRFWSAGIRPDWFRSGFCCS